MNATSVFHLFDFDLNENVDKIKSPLPPEFLDYIKKCPNTEAAMIAMDAKPMDAPPVCDGVDDGGVGVVG